MQPSMRFELVGRVMIAVQTRQNPGDAEWDAFSDFVRKHLGETQRLFLYSAGGAPSVQQRRRLNAITARVKTRGALVTASRVSRAIAVAVSWFHTEFRVFDPDGVGDAIEFLRLAPEETTAVLDCIRRLAGQLNVEVPEPVVLDSALR